MSASIEGLLSSPRDARHISLFLRNGLDVIFTCRNESCAASLANDKASIESKVARF